VLGAIAIVVVGVFSFALLPDKHTSPAKSEVAASKNLSLRSRLSPAVLVLGGIAFVAMLCEGAAADWSANYLRNELGARAGVAGLGYAAFALAMVAMRLSGPVLQGKFSARTLLPVLAVTAAVGVSAALASGNPAAGLLGFGILGIGLALVVPTAFSSAGRLAGSNTNAGTAIATVAALGWIGYVTGPPLIGHLAELVTLSRALWVLPVLALAIAVVVRTASVFKESSNYSATQTNQ
jgi:MFS family permease